MATYVSRASGDWDGAVWSINGVPQNAGVYPDLAGDTVTISVGHTIVYNQQNDFILGLITVNGTLSFARDTDTELLLPTDKDKQLTVSATGTLDIGTLIDPIPDGVTAILTFDTTDMSDVADYAGQRIPTPGIKVVYGGVISIVGDSAYYGGVAAADLDADWSSGQSFTVAADVSSWKVGSRIAIGQAYYSLNAYQHDIIFTVASAVFANGVTTVTVNEAFPTPSSQRSFRGRTGFPAINLSRNVKFRITGSLWRDFQRPWTYELYRHHPLPAGVTLYGTDVYDTAYAHAVQADFAPIYNAEFSRVAIYAGNAKDVNSCSFWGAGLSGGYNSGSGFNDPPSVLIQNSKIDNNAFVDISTAVSWHRDCESLTGNLFATCNVAWSGIYNSSTSGNRYMDCYVAIQGDFRSNVTRWPWVGLASIVGLTSDDDISYCCKAVSWGDYLTINGTIDYCVFGVERVRDSLVTADITNTFFPAHTCQRVTFSGDIAATYAWRLSGDSYAIDSQRLSRSIVWAGVTSIVGPPGHMPNVSRNNKLCLFTGTLSSVYAIEGNDVWEADGSGLYTDINAFTGCAITCLTLFDPNTTAVNTIPYATPVEQAPSIRAVFTNCPITQVDDNDTPAWDKGVRSLAIAAFPASDSQYAKDTYVLFDGCTITELFTSVFSNALSTIYNGVLTPYDGRHLDYYVESINCFNGELEKATHYMSKAVKIINEGDFLARVERFHGTVIDNDRDVHTSIDPQIPTTISVVATPRVCSNPELIPLALKITELVETSVPVLARYVRAFVKLDGTWVVPPTAAQLRLEVDYPNADVGVTTVYSTQTVTDEWTELLVQYTPGAVGTVRSRVMLYTSEGAASVLVDPAFYLGTEG